MVLQYAHLDESAFVSNNRDVEEPMKSNLLSPDPIERLGTLYRTMLATTDTDGTMFITDAVSPQREHAFRVVRKCAARYQRSFSGPPPGPEKTETGP